MVKVSIITTSLNAVGTIRDCLESVKGQTCPDVEHIVVDGASTDGTQAVLAEYTDSLAQVISEADRGIYDGMNKGLRRATGDVVGLLNADDMYCNPLVLEKVAAVFADEQVDSCYGDLVYIAEDKKGSRFEPGEQRTEDRKERVCANRLKEGDFKIVRYWKSGEFDPRKFYWGWMPPHPTFFVRRHVYEKYGYFNLDLGTAADYELMLRFLVGQRISVAYLPEIVLLMRSGGASNVTLQARLQANRMDRKAWEANGLKPYPWTLMLKPLRKVWQWVVKPPVLK